MKIRIFSSLCVALALAGCNDSDAAKETSKETNQLVKDLAAKVDLQTKALADVQQKQLNNDQKRADNDKAVAQLTLSQSYQTTALIQMRQDLALHDVLLAQILRETKKETKTATLTLAGRHECGRAGTAAGFDAAYGTCTGNLCLAAGYSAAGNYIRNEYPVVGFPGGYTLVASDLQCLNPT